MIKQDIDAGRGCCLIDPHGEHDAALMTVTGRRIMWKIDYYDLTMIYGSEDPANKEITRRVLTVMFAEEY